jgi:hypothetical protein
MKARMLTAVFALSSLAMVALSGAAPFQNW